MAAHLLPQPAALAALAYENKLSLASAGKAAQSCKFGPSFLFHRQKPRWSLLPAPLIHLRSLTAVQIFNRSCSRAGAGQQPFSWCPTNVDHTLPAASSMLDDLKKQPKRTLLLQSINLGKRPSQAHRGPIPPLPSPPLSLVLNVFLHCRLQA